MIYIYIIDILLHHIGIEYLSLLIPIYDIYYIHLYGDSEIWYTHIYTIHIDVYLSPLSLYTIHLFPHISPRWAMATLASPAPWRRSMLHLWHGQSWWPRCTMDGRSCWEPWKMWRCGRNKVWIWMWNDSGWSYVDVIVCGMFGLENY